MTELDNQDLQTHSESPLDFLRRNKDRCIIKILSLHSSSDIKVNLKAYHTYLLESGIKDEQIMEVDCKSLSQTTSSDYHEVYQSILDELVPEQRHYIFFSHIDSLEHSEKLINSLALQRNIDLYIVTTNKDTLEEILAKVFPGNYVSYIAN